MSLENGISEESMGDFLEAIGDGRSFPGGNKCWGESYCVFCSEIKIKRRNLP